MTKIMTHRVTKPYASCKNFGNRLWVMLHHYRGRRILKFLVEGDARAFSEDMNREALTYVTFLEAYRAKLNVPVERIDGSTHSPLVCAIATGNFELAAKISALMPHDFGDYDGEELFAFTSMIRAFIDGSPKRVKTALATFIERCKRSGDWDVKTSGRTRPRSCFRAKSH